MLLKSALVLAFSLVCLFALAQNDYLQLSRKGRFAKGYGVGSVLEARLNTGQEFTGYIERMWNDSLQVKPFALRQVPTVFGTPVIDTFFGYRFRFHYRDIAAVPLLKPRSPISVPGILFLGGLGFIAVNLGNVLINKESLTDDDNLTKLGVAAAVMAGGYLWGRSRPSEIRFGKKWTLDYIRMKP